MTNSEIVELLADGYRLSEISKKMDITDKCMEKKIIIIKERASVKTLPQLVANYLRKGIIK